MNDMRACIHVGIQPTWGAVGNFWYTRMTSTHTPIVADRGFPRFCACVVGGVFFFF
jgi:hypothetical protein